MSMRHKAMSLEYARYKSLKSRLRALGQRVFSVQHSVLHGYLYTA